MLHLRSPSSRMSWDVAGVRRSHAAGDQDEAGQRAGNDTYISTALTAGVDIPSLEAQTGVRYDTLRRHYGKWLRGEGADQLRKLVRLAPALAATDGDYGEDADPAEDFECEEGDLNHAASQQTQGKSQRR